MRVCVVAEFYPRAADPVLGVWAHRQALAARAAGADVHVVVLHRPLAPSARAREAGAWRDAVGQPRHAVLDGLDVDYVHYLSPPRSRTYGMWGAWAAKSLQRHLAKIEFDVLHAHNAVPAADAIIRGGSEAPLVVSVHGGDVYYTALHWPEPVRRALGAARVVLANSAGTAQRARAFGAAEPRVVHLGTDVPDGITRGARPRTVVTVGHVIARKRHADVLRAIATLDGVRYLVIGDGPERAALERLARDLDVDAEFTGQLEQGEALRRARECAVFAMPSTDEAFGVAYVEAMAGGVPAIGARGEPGPEEIGGDGMRLVEPGDIGALAGAIGALLEDEAAGAAARATVERGFTWEACGRATVAAYEEALA